MTVEMNREEILRRFEELLDSALANEEPIAGVAPEILSAVGAGDDAQEANRRCDSYTLWAAMTALTQEVKLQGRAFQELNRTLEAQTSRMLDEIRATFVERERNVQRETERRCRKDLINALIDLRDRLDRGRESTKAREPEMKRAASASWVQRVLSRPDGDALETVSALLRGYELGIERLDQTLEDFNAREVRCEGEKFDPRRMNAIESEESDRVPDGTVLEVYRSGYEWNGEVFRPAQVKVSRAREAGKTT